MPNTESLKGRSHCLSDKRLVSNQLKMWLAWRWGTACRVRNNFGVVVLLVVVVVVVVCVLLLLLFEVHVMLGCKANKKPESYILV